MIQIVTNEDVSYHIEDPLLAYKMMVFLHNESCDPKMNYTDSGDEPMGIDDLVEQGVVCYVGKRTVELLEYPADNEDESEYFHWMLGRFAYLKSDTPWVKIWLNNDQTYHRLFWGLYFRW